MEQGIVPNFITEAAAAGLGYQLQIWLIAGVIIEVITKIATEIAIEITTEFLVIWLN